jgi:hypothetical protein
MADRAHWAEFSSPGKPGESDEENREGANRAEEEDDEDDDEEEEEAELMFEFNAPAQTQGVEGVGGAEGAGQQLFCFAAAYDPVAGATAPLGDLPDFAVKSEGLPAPLAQEAAEHSGGSVAVAGRAQDEEAAGGGHERPSAADLGEGAVRPVKVKREPGGGEVAGAGVAGNVPGATRGHRAIRLRPLAALRQATEEWPRPQAIQEPPNVRDSAKGAGWCPQ